MRLLFDLRVALRTAVRSRFVSVLAIAAFALGIGVTTRVWRGGASSRSASRSAPAPATWRAS